MTEPKATSSSTPNYRVSDRTAFGLLIAYIIFRQITQRVGLAIHARDWILFGKPWLIPLMNNSSIILVAAGVGVAGNPPMFVATFVGSIFMSTVAGLILYWAGWRFGHRLAQLSSKPNSPWAGVWNPKQIARAERWMNRWGVGVVFFGRLIEYFTLPVTLVAGASDMKLRRFLFANTLGAAAFAGVFLWLGMEARTRWPWLPDWIEETYAPWVFRIGIGLLVLLVVVTMLGRRMDAQPTTTPSQAPSVPANDEPSVEREVEIKTEPESDNSAG